MTTRIVIQPSEGTQKEFVAQVPSWANEVLEKKGPLAAPTFISIKIWRRMDELQSFYQQEKQELGIVTGEDTDFLATHEAWRGDPRIHICQERVKDVPVCCLDLALLQQCVYMLSVAIKDYDVVTWFTEIGLGIGQVHLLEYMITDTEDEHRIWEVVCANTVPRKLALAFFLKTLLPIEALVSLSVEGAESIKNRWHEAYDWLSETVQEGLVGFAHNTMAYRDKPFQQRMEDVTINLISEASL